MGHGPIMSYQHRFEKKTKSFSSCTSLSTSLSLVVRLTTARVLADASTLLYLVQQQPLGSIQWSAVASNLKETNYTVTSLSKGVRYAFRVLTSTGKTLSKPSPSTDLVQLLDRGTATAQGSHISKISSLGII